MKQGWELHDCLQFTIRLLWICDASFAKLRNFRVLVLRCFSTYTLYTIKCNFSLFVQVVGIRQFFLFCEIKQDWSEHVIDDVDCM